VYTHNKGQYLVFDISDRAKAETYDLPGIRDQIIGTVGHEAEHASAYRLCALILKNGGVFKATEGDPAYKLLAPGMEYGKDMELALEEGLFIGKGSKQYKSQENVALEGEVALGRNYGAQSIDEDKGTGPGEKMLNTAGIAEVVTADQDTTKLGMKISLELTRIGSKRPNVAEFYNHAFAAVKLKEVIQQQKIPIVNRLQELNFNSPNVMTDPEYAELDAKEKELTKLEKFLDDAIAPKPKF
jgi:hypothetical protein